MVNNIVFVERYKRGLAGGLGQVDSRLRRATSASDKSDEVERVQCDSVTDIWPRGKGVRKTQAGKICDTKCTYQTSALDVIGSLISDWVRYSFVQEGLWKIDGAPP